MTQKTNDEENKNEVSSITLRRVDRYLKRDGWRLPPGPQIVMCSDSEMVKRWEKRPAARDRGWVPLSWGGYEEARLLPDHNNRNKTRLSKR